MKWGLANPCREGREGNIPSLAEIVDHDELERWEVTSRCERCCGRISLPASHAGGTRAPADTELTLTQLLRTPGQLPPVARAPMVPVVQHSTSPALERKQLIVLMQKVVKSIMFCSCSVFGRPSHCHFGCRWDFCLSSSYCSQPILWSCIHHVLVSSDPPLIPTSQNEALIIKLMYFFFLGNKFQVPIV